MKPITQQEITDYVETNIQDFHQRRLDNLQKLKMLDVVKQKNPFRTQFTPTYLINNLTP